MNKDLVTYLTIFKKECRYYFKYESDLKREKLELEEVLTQITNIRSPITDRVGGHQVTTHDDLLVSLIEVKSETEYRIDYYEAILDWIKDVIKSIPSPAYRAITWQTLVQAKSRTELMIYYDVDPDYVYRMRDKFITQSLSNGFIEKYNDIQNKKMKSKWLALYEKN